MNYMRGGKRKRAIHEHVTREMLSKESLSDDENAEILEVVYKAIDQLPEERRRIFMMIFVDGKSYQEVMEQLQISKNTVKTQLSRSLKFLRKKLKNRYNEILLFFILKK